VCVRNPLAGTGAVGVYWYLFSNHCTCSVTTTQFLEIYRN